MRKIFVIAFPNYEKTELNQIIVLPEKVAIKLMNENNNLFEEFIGRLYFRFGKLLMHGFHKEFSNRLYSSVTPNRRNLKRFSIK